MGSPIQMFLSCRIPKLAWGKRKRILLEWHGVRVKLLDFNTKNILESHPSSKVLMEITSKLTTPKAAIINKLAH